MPDGAFPTTLVNGVSVLVPVYNGAATIRSLTDRTIAVLDRIVPGAYEVVLINDGSPDDSWDLITELAAEHDAVRGLAMMRNYGQHNALLAGLRSAQFDTVVTMDDDLQHPPEEIPTLLETLEEGHDVVYGISAELPHSPFRNITSRVTKKVLASAMGVGNIRDISAFRALRTELRAAADDYSSPSVMLDVLLSWGTTRFGTVVVEHQPREHGESGYTLAKLVNQAMLVLTGFSTRPLRIASLIGFAFTTFGALVFVYTMARYLTVGSLPGFPFITSLISIFGGVQLFALGIFGEYLARVFDRSMDRPPYVVRLDTASAGPVEESGSLVAGVQQQVDH